jgi:hypothetical protein
MKQTEAVPFRHPHAGEKKVDLILLKKSQGLFPILSEKNPVLILKVHLQDPSHLLLIFGDENGSLHSLSFLSQRKSDREGTSSLLAGKTKEKWRKNRGAKVNPAKITFTPKIA